MDNHLALMQLSGTSDHLLKQRKEQMEMEIFSKVEAICIVDKVSGKTINFTLHEGPDLRFVKKFTRPDSWAKNFTH